jgi:hypothetical protein
MCSLCLLRSVASRSRPVQIAFCVCVFSISISASACFFFLLLFKCLLLLLLLLSLIVVPNCDLYSSLRYSLEHLHHKSKQGIWLWMGRMGMKIRSFLGIEFEMLMLLKISDERQGKARQDIYFGK